MAEALPEEETSAAELVQRARALAPLLAAQAEESERLRRPSDAAIRALEEAGIFRLMVPRVWGGLELDLDTFLEVGLALGEGDASLAWVADFYIEHNWMLCQFPEPFQRELFAARRFVLAPAMVAPTGRAERRGGGFRVSGRWQWASGSAHAQWVLVSAFEADAEAAGPAGAAPVPRFFALPVEDVTVEDTWYVDGMCGTASNDVVVEDAFVPAERSVSILEMVEGRAPGSRLHAGPLYRTPMIPILLLAASMPAVGQARAAVRDFRERLGSRVRFGASARQAESAAAQMRLARAEVAVHQAELLLRDVAAGVMAERDAAPLETRARWAASVAEVVHQCRGVVGDVAEASGGSAHFRHHPLQRAQRDVNVISCHVAFDRDAQRENFGRLRLGLEPSARIF